MTHEAKTVDRDALAQVLARHWPFVKLGDVIKESQNFTYSALLSSSADEDGSSRKVIVRATPDADSLGRVEIELEFLHFLAVHPVGKGLHVSLPIPPSAANDSQKRGAVCEDGLVVVVFEFAPGASPLPNNRWMLDYGLVREWGAWLAKLHAVSRDFSAERKDMAARVRPWDTLHDRVLAGHPVDPADVELAANSNAFGVLHGDLNCSNFFVVDAADGGSTAEMHVFDWDQLQLGWFMYDLALPIWGCVMSASAGTFPSGDPMPGVDPARFTSEIVAGYESISGDGSVDRQHLQRMVDLRRDFYELFCRRSLVRKDLPEGVMTDFVKFVVAWFDRQKKDQ